MRRFVLIDGVGEEIVTLAYVQSRTPAYFPVDGLRIIHPLALALAICGILFEQRKYEAYRSFFRHWWIRTRE